MATVPEATEAWDWEIIRNRCWHEALRIVRRDHDAEEVVQEALIRAWRSRSSCRNQEAPLPWCLEITRNEARRLLARQRTLVTAELLDPEAELVDAKAHEAVAHALDRVDMQRALQELTPTERRLLHLRYDHGCSHPEIAAALRITETAARIRLHRLHKRIKPLL